MKKTYIAPVVEGVIMDAESLLAASITGITGDAGINLNEGTTDAEADVKASIFEENPFE